MVVRFLLALVLAGFACAPALAQAPCPAGSTTDTGMATYLPTNTQARAALDRLSSATAAKLGAAISEHGKGSAPGSEASNARVRISAVVSATCHTLDVDRDVEKALSITQPSLVVLDATTRHAARIAYRDLFSAFYASDTIDVPDYDAGIDGFGPILEPPAIAPGCDRPDAPASIAGLRVEPEFPEIAKSQGASGTTIVTVVLDAVGNIDDVAIYKSSGFPSLDRSTLRAAAATHYISPIVHCTSVSGTYTFKADFGAQ